MAITIVSSPSATGSVHNGVNWVVSSTNYTQTNFKFVCDVIINSTLVARLKAFPNPAYPTKTVFDLSSILRSYIQTYFGKSSFTIQSNSNNIFLTYTVQFGEEYNGTTYTNLTNATTTSFNYYDTLFGNLVYSSFSNNWLTNRDKAEIETAMGEKTLVSFLSSSDTLTAHAVYFVKKDASGNNIGSPAYVGDFDLYKFSLLDLSPDGFNSEFPSSIASTDYGYGIYFYNGVANSPEIKFKMVCNPKYTPVNLIFLNQLGGYDSFSFRLVNKQTRNYERKGYAKNIYQFNGTNVTSELITGVKNAESINYFVSQSRSMKITSDWLNETNYNLMAELLASPEVYAVIDGTYYPVSVNQQTWEEKKSITDKTFNVQFNIDFSHKVKSQFR